MLDELKHECAVAMVVLRRPPSATGDFGGTKLSLLLEKQHNRGQDGAGAAILRASPVPGEEPYWIAKSASATPLADVLAAIGKRVSRKERIERKGAEHAAANNQERIFLGHLRYATYGKNDVAFCHPFVHESSDLSHTLLLAGNFNLTNAHELFDDYARHGSFPTSKADGYLICELIAHEMERKSSCHLADALANALKNADGAWTLCGMTADGWAFATRDPHGIRPGYCYIDERVVVVASERPAIQAAFDVPPEAVKELPPGEALVASPQGDVEFVDLNRAEHVERVEDNASDLHVSTRSTRLNNLSARPCSFERIYFSRANDAVIHRERKALGAALLPRILEAAETPLEDIFFSYIPNSARTAFHGLLEKLFEKCVLTQSRVTAAEAGLAFCSEPSRAKRVPRDAELSLRSLCSLRLSNLSASEPFLRTHGYAPRRIVPPFCVTPRCSSMRSMTGCVVCSSNSVELASFHPSTLRAYSITVHCIPRQMPRKGILCSRAYLIAAILPSTPLDPKPPGTKMPSISFNGLFLTGLTRFT